MRNPTLSRLADSIGAPSLKTLLVSLYDTIPDATLLAHTLHELDADTKCLETRPWRNLPQYFTQVLVSTLALVKMSTHAKMGGLIEVMGMLTGKIVQNTFVVMDVYSLPVEGTETRVNAQSEGYEYMVQYLDLLKAVGIEDSIVGWYHSHPGYGCWLSGIDVATQSLNQNFQDPYLAIVVDPVQTANQGKVEIGAFRTFPVGHVALKKAPDSDVQIRKKRDLGAHSGHYYPLDIKLFKSPRDDALVDNILNKSWVSNLAILSIVDADYERRLLAKLSTVIDDMNQLSGSRETRANSRFNTIFESLILRRSSVSNCRTRPAFAGLLPTAEVEGESDDQTAENEDDEDEDEDEDMDEDDNEVEDVHDDDGDDVLDDRLEGQTSRGTETEEMDHRSITNVDSADEREVAPEKNLARTVLMRKDLGPVQLDSRDTSLSELNFSARERHRSAQDQLLASGSTEVRHRMQIMALDLKRRNSGLSSIAHAELLDLVAQKTKREVFGKLSL